MIAFDYGIAALVVLAISYVFVKLYDVWDGKRVAAGMRRIGISACPRCGQMMGADVAATAARVMIKYGTETGRRLHYQRHPSQLLVVACPHCSVELQYRLDGSLFPSDDEVAA